MNFNGYNCPDCLRYVREGLGVFRTNKEGKTERYCWRCRNVELEYGEDDEE